jgi:hypothetical protein
MSAVNEAIVREFFESLGYAVSQPCKYSVPGRAKHALEELDLLVTHPLVREHVVPEHIVWTTEDLSTIARAVVSVRGWHTERMSVAKLEQTPELLRFVDKPTHRLACERLGSDQVASILCLPQLPVSGELKEKTLHTLKSRGVDGVLSFRTMLLRLLEGVNRNRNYDKSDLLQTLRILKTYGLLSDTQLDLFGARKRKTRAATPPGEAPPAAAEERG